MRSLLLALSLLVFAAPAQGAVIRVTDAGVFKAFGDFKPSSNMKLSRAVKVFGAPDERDPVGDGSVACDVLWAGTGLVVKASNFGGVPEGHTACEGRHGFVQVLTARGLDSRPHWRTDRGLRVGASKARMLRLYSRAHSIGRGVWSLLERDTGIGDGPTPILTARVRSGKVSSISVWAGGAGD